ncbi:MAG: EAL domain-containing protein [Hyphomicrobium sp.]|nr:EAL domain-containing protein [Hyphomicrobium sp.]
MGRPAAHDDAFAAPPDAHAGPVDTETLAAHAQKLSQLNAWFEIALNNMARGLSMFDAERRLIVCNALYREIYGLPEELTLPGTPFSRILAYHAANEGAANTIEELRRQQLWIEHHAQELTHGRTFTHTQYLKNGRVILVTNQPLADGGWVDIQEDITERTLADERIGWLARHCPLTEIANRFHICEKLQTEIDRLKPGGCLAVHIVDLDHFKHVNDTLGHAAGDAVLKAVAKRISAIVRDTDFVGRLGGDEFAIVQTDITSPEQAAGLARRLVATLNAPYRVLGSSAGIGASIGIAVAPEHGLSADALLRKADMALSRVKGCGRGSSCIYRPDDEAMASERVVIEGDLRAAIERRQLALVYQPILDVEAGVVTGCEALLRWHHPTLGSISPSTFVPIAERSGSILEIGAWVLHRACHDAVGWSAPINVAVNFSAVQFAHGDLAALVAHELVSSGLDPARLEIEISEAALLRADPRTFEAMEKLRALGVRLVLDDFGTGFACLDYLRTFIFDKIKIDRAFIGGMAERRDSMAIVGAAAGLAKALDIGPVAEGIEGLAQLNGVRETGCRQVQGFYFCRPVPSDEVEAAVAQCLAKLEADTAAA